MSKKITVYRVEDENKEGPYQSNSGYWDKYPALKRHTRYTGRPGIIDFTLDVQWSIDDSYFFGFDSIKKVFAWFGGLLPIFYKETTLRIVKYEIEESDIYHSISKKQILFKRP